MPILRLYAEDARPYIGSGKYILNVGAQTWLVISVLAKTFRVKG